MQHTEQEYEGAVAAATAAASIISRAEGYAEPRTAHGYCVIASDRLAETLNGVTTWFVRVIGQTYPGREHWALLIPRWHDADGEADLAAMTGTVIDLTCRQFDAEAPAVFVGSVDDWLDDGCEWLVDGLIVEVYTDTEVDDDKMVWQDFHSRDDIEPGPLVYPWEQAAV